VPVGRCVRVQLGFQHDSDQAVSFKLISGHSIGAAGA
jgi:hypothetical protein